MRNSEMREELYEAVFAGDLARAEAQLDAMQRYGVESEAIRVAKRRARPGLVAHDLRDPAPLVLPQGAPGTMLAGNLWK